MPDVHEADSKEKDKDMNEEQKDIDTQDAPETEQAVPPEDGGKDPCEELKAQLEDAKAKRDEYLDMAQRIQAEFENYKRRNRTAIQDASETATDETILAFLPVLDNLERALAAANESEDVEDIVTGVEMVIKQFTDLLAQMDVKAIEAVGQPFDPVYHHAVMKTDATDPQEVDTVVEELVKGYMRKDKVLRYSMVKVAN